MNYIEAVKAANEGRFIVRKSQPHMRLVVVDRCFIEIRNTHNKNGSTSVLLDDVTGEWIELDKGPWPS